MVETEERIACCSTEYNLQGLQPKNYSRNNGGRCLLAGLQAGLYTTRFLTQFSATCLGHGASHGQKSAPQTGPWAV